MAFGGVNAGNVFVRLGFQVDESGAEKFERRHVRTQKLDDIKTRLEGDFDPKQFNVYEKRLDEVQARVKRRDAFKATLGGDYNPQAFRAYERDLAKAERDTLNSQSRLSKTFSSTAAKAAGGFAAAGGVTAFTLFAKNATNAASDIGESLTKNQVLFGKYAKDVEAFSKTSAANFGISRKAVLEYAGTFGNLFRAFGTSQEKSAGLSTELTKLAADMASFNNTSIEDALEALRSGLVGESEPLRKFGVNLNEGALQAEALSSGLVKAAVDQDKLKIATQSLDLAQQNVAKAVKKHGAESMEAQRANIALQRAQAAVNKTAAGGKVQLDAQQKALAVVALTTKQTEAAHGDFARTSTGLANQQRILSARLSDIAASIGEKLLPIALRAATAFNKLVDEWDRGVGTGGEIRDTAEDIGNAISGTVGFLRDHTTWVKLAVEAWVAYKVAVTAAALASKVPFSRGAPPVPVGVPSSGPPTVVGGPASRFSTAAKTGAVLGAGLALSQIGEASDRGTFGKNIEGVTKEAEKLAKLGRSGEIRKLADSITDVGLVKIKVDGVNELGVGAKNVKKLQDALRDLAKESDDLKLAPQMEIVNQSLASVSKTGGKHLRDIKAATKNATEVIKDRLGSDTEAGKNALARNFRAAAKAVKESMDDGKISVKTGTAEIRRLLAQELANMGFTPQQAQSLAANGAREVGQGGSSGKGGMKRAGGGWIGMPGMTGTDTVPAMLAPGEAVLNRHQQAVVEGYLGDGFLDDLFAKVQTPHYMAKGGIVPVPGFPGERAAASVVPTIQSIAQRFGLRLTDAFGQGHKSPGHTRFGTAADFAGPDRSMDAAVKYLVGRGYVVGYDGRFGSQAWPGHGPTSVAGGNAHLHVELGSGGGVGAGVAAMFNKLRSPRSGGRGLFGGLTQRALDLTTAGANSVLERAASDMGGPVGGGGDGGAGGASEAQARRWIAAGLRLAGVPATPANVALMVRRARQESGLNPRAINNWDSNAKAGTPSKGLLQTIDPTFQAYKVKGHNNIYNPVDNTAAAARYMLARYGRLVDSNGRGYNRGGFVRRFAKGGKVTKGRIMGSKGALGLFVPPDVQPPRMAISELESAETSTRTALNTAKETLKGLPSALKDADAAVSKVENRTATTPAAREKKIKDFRAAVIRRDKARTNLAEAKRAEASRRRAWTKAKTALNDAKKWEGQIAVQVRAANTAASDMSIANRKGDRTGYLAARARRTTALTALKGLYARARTALKDQTGPAAEELAGLIDGNLGDLEEAEAAVDETFSPEQARTISELDRDAALAALTEDGNVDDLAVATLNENLSRQWLGAAQAEGRGPDAIREFAERLKGAQDARKSLETAAADPSVDQQAVIDRQAGIIELANKNAQLNAQALAVFSGSGDLGLGGANAWRAAQPQITINTLHPGTPEVMRAIGDAATSGMNLQNSIQSPRIAVG